jgi:hypothetical protein
MPKTTQQSIQPTHGLRRELTHELGVLRQDAVEDPEATALLQNVLVHEWTLFLIGFFPSVGMGI